MWTYFLIGIVSFLVSFTVTSLIHWYFRKKREKLICESEYMLHGMFPELERKPGKVSKGGVLHDLEKE